MNITGNIVDLHAGTVFGGTLVVHGGRIAEIRNTGEPCHDTFLMPGFVDAHVHIESSMLPPPEFARLALPHGTVAVVTDPHEIGNVLGIEGVRYMQEAASHTPLKCYFGAPSCVPATPFETAGATISLDDVRTLLDDPHILYLSEVMNYPGVLNGDPDMMAKIQAAHDRGKRVDGHAPGLRGEEVRRYAAAGITTDHECFTLEEALDKIACGMKIAIREGSAARNLDALMPLLSSHPEHCFLCTDDSHPDTLLEGHIDTIARRAINAGHAPMNVLRAACANPVLHYGLDVGLLRVGDPADFIEVDDLANLRVLRTFIGGTCVAEVGATRLPFIELEQVNHFQCSPKHPEDFRVAAEDALLRVIEARDGQLVTGEIHLPPHVEKGWAIADPARDILKLAVVNRYADAPPAVAFIRNFGLTRGAIAASVAHDSHNILAVAADDVSLTRAVNAVIEMHGGLTVVNGDTLHRLPLPIAGLMSHEEGHLVAERYQELTAGARALGATLEAPFMTLSFMALLVIPDLKLSDLGLFSGSAFTFVEPWLPRSSPAR